MSSRREGDTLTEEEEEEEEREREHRGESQRDIRREGASFAVASRHLTGEISELHTLAHQVSRVGVQRGGSVLFVPLCVDSSQID